MDENELFSEIASNLFKYWMPHKDWNIKAKHNLDIHGDILPSV